MAENSTTLHPPSGGALLKLGLALSGGGFRASLFHIGVLARMADLGLLRQVEVISTVSGGSIIGAHYYLHVKKLLESNIDSQITDDDYRRLVRDVEQSFLVAVKRNIRMRIWANPVANLRMLLPSYSRGDRLGWLYDRYIYRPAWPGATRETMIEMRELKIAPLTSNGKLVNFRPTAENAGRSAKVPVLLINATCLNNGHSWRFEAVRMGAKALAGREPEVNKNIRLRRPNDYADITPKQQNIELGLAVAASSAVPGVFPPLALSGLYPGTRIQLVDGGVYDNQGSEALIDPEVNCTHLVVSDGSGQLMDDKKPSHIWWRVIQRTTDIIMERVRVEDMASLLDDAGRKTAMVHLRKGLPTPERPFVDKTNAAPGPDIMTPDPGGSSTAFGIPERIQSLVSAIRTDLDSFCDIEANALMLSGYRMINRELAKLDPFVPAAAATTPDGDWPFLELESKAMWKDVSNDLQKHLRVAGRSALKPLSWTSGKVMAVVYLAVLALLVAYAGWPIAQWAYGVGGLMQYLIYAGLIAVLGAAAVSLYLATFNALYLRIGRLPDK